MRPTYDYRLHRGPLLYFLTERALDVYPSRKYFNIFPKYFVMCEFPCKCSMILASNWREWVWCKKFYWKWKASANNRGKWPSQYFDLLYISVNSKLWDLYIGLLLDLEEILQNATSTQHCTEHWVSSISIRARICWTCSVFYNHQFTLPNNRDGRLYITIYVNQPGGWFMYFSILES